MGSFDLCSHLRVRFASPNNKYESLCHTEHSKAFCCPLPSDTCSMFCSLSTAICKRACEHTFESTSQCMMDVLEGKGNKLVSSH